MGKALVLGSDISRIYLWEAERLSPEAFLSYWPMISQELDRIPHTWNTYWTKEFIRDAVMNGRFQIWGFGPPETVCLMVFTQVVYYPANMILEIILGFGNGLDDALPLIEATFERFAQEQNCTLCEIRNGRPGWSRKLDNFKCTGITLRRKVEKQGVH